MIFNHALSYFSAPSYHNGLSRALRTNLLVSSFHASSNAKRKYLNVREMGSGIYQGFSDLGATYTYGGSTGHELVLSPVVSCKSSTFAAAETPVVTLEEPIVVKVKMFY